MGFMDRKIVPSSVTYKPLLVESKNSLVFDASVSSKPVTWNQNARLWNGGMCDEDELRQLHLDGVDLSSEGNEWCNALSSSVQKLQVLGMSNCFLSGPVDSSLVNLHHLSFIQLNGNNLSTPVPKFLARFTNLTTLRLSYCGLYGEFPSKIFQAQTLQILDLSGHQLLQGPLPNFPEDSSLETLVLTYTSISGRLPDSIGSVPSFSMSKNQRQIVLFRNAPTGEIKSTRWAELISLVYLDLWYNSLEGSIPWSLFILPSVKIIKLSDNQFSGELSGSLNVTCYQLTLLDLSSNNLGGPIPAYGFELRGLGYLSLSSNNFSGSLHIDAFQRLKNLTYLDLSHNRLSINATASTSAMFGFPTLYTLKLASCQLSSLPEFLENQPLRYLDLSDNQIQGEIPKWIWESKLLSYVNLSFNFFDKLGEPLPNLTYTLSVIDLHRN
ncbi:receptor-like protein 50 [Syzygium oleosum]|uniref:receptor-like protein 50 n=1 Tax=Syzygium oleosum TaxID=219896 RepID=UPI0024B8B4EB|nr:receptor-like protein 50 [Syzygium oleosum]